MMRSRQRPAHSDPHHARISCHWQEMRFGLASRITLTMSPGARGSGFGSRPASTLLEMMVALLIGLAILAASLGIASTIFYGAQAEREAMRVTRLADAVRHLRQSAGYATGATLRDTLITMNMVPDGLTAPGQSGDIGVDLVNQWGGKVFLTSQDGGANFAITYTNIPGRVCAMFVRYVHASSVLHAFAGGPASATTGSSVLIDLATTGQVNTACATKTVSWTSGGPVAP